MAWFTEFRGDRHLVLTGDPVGALSEADVRRTVAAHGSPGVTVVDAGTVQLSRVAEDADSRLPGDRRPVSGIVARDVYRHHGEVAAPARPHAIPGGQHPGRRTHGVRTRSRCPGHSDRKSPRSSC